MLDFSTATSALTAFLHAFSRLDLSAMLDCFAAEATAFFPIEHHHHRLDGKQAIGQAFAKVLAKMKARGMTSLALEPQDFRMESWGDSAVATFHLPGEHLGRRTVVLGCQAGQWRIVHLHASNAPLGE